ncbi:hypothetical protein [Algoriphagus sp. D3-2-R+10]|uniref:hypothetical protein n=1 Tax=Algoriphagus aurantiacus TaxID=3103948 RepID=UPI002B4077FA|nr:hypothetical protein [Algoriphagus sp. D3-2-R+10]
MCPHKPHDPNPYYSCSPVVLLLLKLNFVRCPASTEAGLIFNTYFISRRGLCPHKPHDPNPYYSCSPVVLLLLKLNFVRCPASPEAGLTIKPGLISAASGEAAELSD